MVSQSLCQTISKGEVKTIINSDGDTLIVMNVSDARYILNDVLDKEILDSLMVIYVERDSLKSNVISLQTKIIKDLEAKSINHESQITNLNKMISNKDSEIVLKDDIIKKQKKEIRKQKFLKVVGFTIAVVLPVTIAIFQHL